MLFVRALLVALTVATLASAIPHTGLRRSDRGLGRRIAAAARTEKKPEVMKKIRRRRDGPNRMNKGGKHGAAPDGAQEGAAGACGNTYSDSAYIVALAVDMYGDTGAVSSYCGKSVTITNTANSKSVTATIEDACPGCSGASLDLSVGTFEAIGDLDTGVLDISWSIN
ncbi:expansin family protein [Pseudohyphozyma bogoriensis]|nr:expansin family protein [Pseudohyphozyma bogoriensis]